MKLKEFMETMPQREEMWRKKNLCPECKINQITQDDCNCIDRKRVCDDCYYDALGEAIEKHPIFTPVIKRT